MIELPSVEPESVADCYMLYVCIAEIPEDVFWYCDIGLVKAIAANKQAYERWLNWQRDLRDGKQKRSKGKTHS